MAIGGHTQSSFTLIYVSLAYLRKPGPQFKNCERAHIFSKAFLFVSILHFLRCSARGTRVPLFHYFSIENTAPLMVTSSHSFVVSDMCVTHSVKNSQGALVKLRN